MVGEVNRDNQKDVDFKDEAFRECRVLSLNNCSISSLEGVC
jgi:hypothetical protein